MKQYRLLFEIVTMLPVLPIFYYGRLVHSKMEKEIKIYWIFLLFSFTFQLGLIITSRYSIHNISAAMIYQVVEYVVLSLLFYMWIPNKIIRVIILIFLFINLYSWAHFFTGKNIDYSVTIDKYLRNFILIPLSFLTAYKLAVQSKIDMLKNIEFWIVGGLLVNITITAFTQVMQAYVLHTRELRPIVNNVLLLVNTLSAIMFIKGYLCLKAQMKFIGS